MENVSRKLPVWVTVVMVILSAGAAVWSLIALVGGNIGTGTVGIIGAVALILTGILAIIYIAGGHQKKVAGFYLGSLIAFAAANLFEVISCFRNAELKNMIASGIVMLVALLVMIFVKNLGRGFNYVLGGILLLTALTILIQTVISEQIGTVTAEAGAGVLYSVVILILICAKFKDKEARGRWVGDEAELK